MLPRQTLRWAQVSGLTKLLEGQKDASQGAGSRKENRRETWCPGAQGEGDLPHPPLTAAQCISLHKGSFILSAYFTCLVLDQPR